MSAKNMWRGKGGPWLHLIFMQSHEIHGTWPLGLAQDFIKQNERYIVVDRSLLNQAPVPVPM
jgi:hypothetical protein